MRDLIDTIRAGDDKALRQALSADFSLASKPRLVVEAARVASPAALQALFERGADPNATWRGYRPLHALIQERLHHEIGDPSVERLESLDLLLSRGANPELLGAFPSARAILVAAFTGIVPLVERLRGAGAKIDGHVFCALGDAPAVARHLEQDAGFARARDSGGLTGLHCACASRLGRRDERARLALLNTARHLIDAGADPNARVKSWSEEVDVAYFAIAPGNLELFELLLDHGADPTAALPTAVWKSEFESAGLALRRGADPDRAIHDGRPLLNDLVRWGQVGQALWLLQHGASPDVPDARGWTALHQAASRGNARMLQALVAAGADPTRRDVSGHTPLNVARELGREKAVAVLTGC